MYLPPAFKQDRPEVLQQWIHDRPLASLIVWNGAGMVANHIPMLFDATAAPHKLVGHVAKANPLWRTCAEGSPALAIFSGPQHYVSPSWYPSKQETGQVVPTWNYVVVHVHGRLGFIHDADWLRGLVSRLTERMEAGRASPWSLGDAPADYVDRMLNAIVGVELTITRVEGKFKLSQNRSDSERQGVLAGLEAEPRDDASLMAALMRL